MPCSRSRDDQGSSKFGLLLGTALVAAGGLLYYKKLQKERTPVRVPEAPASIRKEPRQNSSPVDSKQYDGSSYFGKPKEDTCNICFFPFDDSTHHPISFIPCKHVCCAECSRDIVSVCHVCRGAIESRALLFSS